MKTSPTLQRIAVNLSNLRGWRAALDRKNHDTASLTEAIDLLEEFRALLTAPVVQECRCGNPVVPEFTHPEGDGYCSQECQDAEAERRFERLLADA